MQFRKSDLLNDLIWYVDKRKLILVGDPAQLLPMGQDDSPALNIKVLSDEYHLRTIEAELTEIVRQTGVQGILQNAAHLREKITCGDTDQTTVDTSSDNICHIEGIGVINLLKQATEELLDQVIIVTYSNREATSLINQ
jgi:exodeoxyribonuclease-5